MNDSAGCANTHAATIRCEVADASAVPMYHHNAAENDDTIKLCPMKTSPSFSSAEAHQATINNQPDEVVFLGDIFWSWMVAAVRWVLRNPKTFSSMLVTLMLVLFTNYAQNIVVDVVGLVIRAHPAVVPTNELRSRTAIIGNELRSLINVAQTTGAAYLGRNVTCSDVSSITSTEFLNVPFALQTSFGVSLYFVYMSYQIAGTSHWGDCGCLGTSYSVADSAICGYVDSTGMQYAFRGTNVSKSYAAPIPGGFTEYTDYGTIIRGLTIADQKAGGVWHAPTRYEDPFVKQNITVLTYTYPLLFDPKTGLCTVAASIDVGTELLSSFLQSKLPVNADIAMVGYGRGRSGLRFISENLEGALGTEVYSAAGTPRARVNNLVNTVASYASGLGSTAGVMQNTSFVANGMLYQSLTVLDTWSILAQGPTTVGTFEIGEALLSLMSEFERSSLALRASYLFSPETCESSLASNSSSMFLRELSNLLASFGPQVFGAYLAYPFASKGNSSANGAAGGACGCDQVATRTGGTGTVAHQSCYYVSPSLQQLSFPDPRYPKVSQKSATFSGSRRSVFLQAILPTLTTVNASGVWTEPSSFYDTLSAAEMTIVSFVLPLAFGPDGACTQAIVMDVNLVFVPRLLSKFTRGGFSEVHLIDLPSGAYLGSSSTWFQQDVFPFLVTPNTTVNYILQQVVDAAGSMSVLTNTLDRLSVVGRVSPGSPSDRLINFGRVIGDSSSGSVTGTTRTRWGVVEMMGTQDAQDAFYPVPAITSSSQALALLPMDVNLRLFAIVLLMMFVYTLNLFILGCSTVGGDGANGGAAPSPPVPSPNAVVPPPTSPMPLLSGQTPRSHQN